MAISFPISVDSMQFMYASVLGHLHAQPEMALSIQQLRPGETKLQEHAERVQQQKYMESVEDLVGKRMAERADLYALSWFLLAFHASKVLAGAYGVPDPQWSTELSADSVILSSALYDLGIDVDKSQIRDHLLQPPVESAELDVNDIKQRLFRFQAHVQYLSSAAVRRGHRVGWHAPAASVFISHAHEDREFVNGLVNVLEDNAVNVWLDSSDLKSASALDNRLVVAINRQQKLVVVLTNHVLGSHYVAYEVAQALELGKDLLPVSLVPIEELAGWKNPLDGSSLTDALFGFPIEECAGVGWAEAYQRVLRSLQNTEQDLTRWREDEASMIAAVFGKLSGS